DFRERPTVADPKTIGLGYPKSARRLYDSALDNQIPAGKAHFFASPAPNSRLKRRISNIFVCERIIGSTSGVFRYTGIRSAHRARKLTGKRGKSMSAVLTVCFSGTSCSRDEGEASRDDSDMRIYSPDTGYIPVRIHKEISGSLRAKSPSV